MSVDLATHLQALWKKQLNDNNTGSVNTHRYLSDGYKGFNYDEFVQCIDDSHKLKEQSELLRLLLYGYIRQHYAQKCISEDIVNIIEKKLWMISSKTIECIQDSYSMTLILDKYLNDAQNKCPYSKNKADDFNILKYIFIRGGALRDSCLMREINDIDIVLDAHSLSIKFLYHLNKYHSNPTQQSNDEKCIFWRHYLNKFNPTNLLWDDLTRFDHNDDLLFRSFGTNSSPKTCTAQISENEKIESFLRKIEKSTFMINCRFILDALRKGGSFKNKKDSEYGGELEIGAHSAMFRHYHWKLIWKSNLLGSTGYNYNFDLVDGPQGWYSAGGTVPDYKAVYTQDNISKFLQIIDEYDQHISRGDRNEISVPIYPIPFDVKYYDFTINAMHISFDSVLNAGPNTINWCDLISIKNENEIINRFNIIGLKDIKNKILRPPSLDVLNTSSGQKYFERLLKMTRRFLDKIKRNIWKLDEEYLEKMSILYDEWFVYKDFKENKKKWNGGAMYWFLVDCFSDSDWKGISESYFCETLHVFRCIRFEKALKMKMKECSKSKEDIQGFWISHFCIDNNESLQKVKSLSLRFKYNSELIDNLTLEKEDLCVDEDEDGGIIEFDEFILNENLLTKQPQLFSGKVKKGCFGKKVRKRFHPQREKAKMDKQRNHQSKRQYNTWHFNDIKKQYK